MRRLELALETPVVPWSMRRQAPPPEGVAMQVTPLPATDSRRVIAGLPFVEALARRLASSMPHSIDLGDLVQDGVLGLIDAAQRYDESRGIKFETFAERRVRGAMIDALRREAWPRGVRRQRRELEAARESLRRELGHEPSVADLAARVGSDEKRLNRTIVRINTIESTSPLASADHHDESTLPAVLVPSEPEAPDTAFERTEVQDRVRAAIATLPPRERKLIGLYYFGEVTMKEIGAQLGVNESRVSQLHARAIQRLRQALEPVEKKSAQPPILTILTPRPRMAPRPVLPFEPRPVPVKASLPARPATAADAVAALAPVLPYASTSRTARSKSASLNGLASQRQPLSSRKRSASAPTTSPVQKMTRRASAGLRVAIAR
jgi:RNA polymerase sigma factor for flagellar operon FliA